MSKPKKRVFSGVADPETAQPILQYEREQAEFKHVPGRYIERLPLRFDGKGASSLNYSRLPAAGQRAKMEMAFREEPLSDTLLLEYADRRLMAFIALVAAIGIVFGSAFPLIDPFLIPYLLPGAVFLGFGVAFMQVLSRGFRGTNRLLLILFLPPAAVLLLKLLSLLIQWRLPASGVLTVATFWAIHRFGHRFFYFYDDWLLTEPALTPENREELRGKTICLPDYLFAISVFGAAVILPWLSPTIAFLTVAGIIVAFILRYARDLFGRYRLTGLLTQVRQMLGIYLSYGESTTLAPGVWVPGSDVNKRKLQFAVVVGLTALTFTVALQGYFPWDIPFVFRQDFLEVSTKETLAETHGWTRVAIAAAVAGDTRFVWCFPFALILSLAVPAVSLFLIFLPTLVAAADRRQLILSAPNRDRPEWQWYVDRLRSSEHEAKDPLQHTTVREKEHLFLGIDPVAHHPVLLDRRILAEHVYIVGESGSGKTSLGIMPLLVQLIRGDSAGVEPKRLETQVKDSVETTITCPNCRELLETSGAPRVQEFECPTCSNDFAVNLSVAAMPRKEDPPPPIVILDLKGDPALFHTVRAEAEERCPGSFRWFTPEKGSSSHCFNPFLDFSTDSRTMVQVCELILEALGLSHGEGYGRSYFTRQSRMALIDALKHDPPPRSFQELNETIKEFMRVRPGEYSDVSELVSTLRVLAEYEQLSLFTPLKYPEDAIHMPSVLENRQTVYFWLPAALESVSVREIGKLALYALLSAAISRQRERKEPRQCYLIIDEFQRIAGENFRIILEQARSFGIGVILANQTQTDLQIPGFDLRPTVRTNTRTKVYFSISDPYEIRDLQAVSGDELAEVKTEGGGIQDFAEMGDKLDSGGEFMRPRLTTNEVLATSDHPLDCIVHISRGSGYTQYGGLPIRVRSNYPLFPKVYRHRTDTEPWPDLEPYVLKEGVGVVGSQSPGETEEKRNEYMQEFEDLLRGLFDEMDVKFKDASEGDSSF